MKLLFRVGRYLIAIIALTACLLAISTAWRMGYARTLAEYVIKASYLPTEYQVGSLAAAEEAVRLSSSDPEAHLALGIALMGEERIAEAVSEFERAAELRPRDYNLWLRLGGAREEIGDYSGALLAYDKAVLRAPYYAQPRWQRGNLLLRLNRDEEAFAQLRQASQSDPSLLPAMIDLTWGFYGGDAQRIEQAVQPQTPEARLALAQFFAKRGKSDEAMHLFRGSNNTSQESLRALLVELLNAKRFNEAYEVWLSMQNESGKRSDKLSITNGGFEDEIRYSDPGFGWQIARDQQSLRVSLDTNGPHSGSHSLRIDWGGDLAPSTRAVWQLMLVEPNKRYRLSFAARTEELVTGGLPIMSVIDASSKDDHLLTQSSALSTNTSGWREFSAEFITGEATGAVLIIFNRQNCSSAPCPIFGRAWLDDFSLEKL